MAKTQVICTLDAVCDEVTLHDSELSITELDASEVLTLTDFVGAQGLQGPPGPQGPQGEQGIPGAPGNAAGGFEFEQTTPSAVWIINHNFGRRVNVLLLDDMGKEVRTDVEQLPPYNVLTATFAYPRTGSGVIS